MKTVILSSFRNKNKYLIFMSLFVISFIMILVLISTKEYYQYVLDSGIGSKIENRKLLVLNNEYFPEALDTNDYIKEYYPNTNINSVFNNEKLLLSYLTEDELKLTSGKYISNTNEIIVPKKLESYLNNNINIKVDNQEYTLKVVGISDIDNIVVSKNFLNQLIESFNLEIEYYNIISNNYNDIEKIIDLFNQNGYVSFLASDEGLSEYNELSKFIDMLYMFIYILIIFDFIFIIYIIKNIINNEKKEMAIFKAIGFSNLRINFIIISRILLMVIISSLLSLLLFIIILNVIVGILNADYIQYTLKYQYMSNYIIFILLVISLVLLNIIYVFFNIKKVDVIKNLMED